MLLRPHRDVLTTRRCGLPRVAHLGDAAPFWAGHPSNVVLARMLPVLPMVLLLFVNVGAAVSG